MPAISGSPSTSKKQPLCWVDTFPRPHTQAPGTQSALRPDPSGPLDPPHAARNLTGNGHWFRLINIHQLISSTKLFKKNKKLCLTFLSEWKVLFFGKLLIPDPGQSPQQNSENVLGKFHH